MPARRLKHVLVALFVVSVAPIAHAADAPAQNKEIRFHLDFDHVDIVDVVKAIAEWTKTDFIVPENVRGKITVIGPAEVTASEAYDAFIAALAVNDLCVVRAGRFRKIVPAKECIRGDIPTILSGATR